MADSERSAGEEEMFALERERIGVRRDAERLVDRSEGVCALAISGGGIRSATLGFGVMQALATVSLPGAVAATDRVPPSCSVLARFDYLSTVSGGGYIGAFFCSLFVPGRLRGKQMDPNKATGAEYATAADDAYATMAYVPPGRLHSYDVLDARHIGKCPTAWLRDNGRYLAPGGAGDYLYMTATAIRNWAAVHYVLGTLFLCTFTFLALARILLVKYASGHFAGATGDTLHRLLASPWGGPLWIAVVLVIALWVLPSGLAFWLSYPGQASTGTEKPQPLGMPALCAAAFVVPLIAGGSYLFRASAQPAMWMHSLHIGSVRGVAVAALATGVALLVGVLYYVFAAWQEETLTTLRVRLTAATGHALGWLSVLALVALAETIGACAYRSIFHTTSARGSVLPGLLAFLVWAVRNIAKFFDGKKVTTLRSQAMLGAASAVTGGLMLLFAAGIWQVLVCAIVWLGQTPDVSVGVNDWWQVEDCLCLLLFSIWLARTAGAFPGFLNLSALQPIYGARLTRAYLGATNGRRFLDGADPTWRSAAQPQVGDQLSLDQYYDRRSRTPIHIINVTLNQTVDPADALIQRDRKGRPLAVLPDGFSVDGEFWQRDNGASPKSKSLRRGKGTEPLSVGEWVGTSGAAVSTGLGRATTFGTSLALGLANMRLGVWWSSGKGKDESTGAEHAFKAMLRTQMFLLYELSGRFYGLNREWQYLSDGGHFENTAIYELLRRGRDVRLIVACDNGCDPDYKFDDLANLIRLARIDFSLDIEVDSHIAKDPALGEVFGTLDQFAPKAPASDKCAILLNVFRSGEQFDVREPICRMVLIKPRVIASAPIDLVEYKQRHADFPQQSTANQFFGEAQWESYRELGYRIGRRIFAPAAEGGAGTALWKYLGVLAPVIRECPGPQPTVAAA